MSEVLLEARGLVRLYGRGLAPALDGVDLTVTAGRSLGIVGESGAGKSTLLRLLLGLDAPTSGSVEFRGAALDRGDRASMREYRREVQVVFQDPRSSLDPRMSVAGIVEEPLRGLKVGGTSRAERRATAAASLAAVGLDESFLGRRPGELSGGQRQRVAIARALAPRPSVLIGDEPVSALDVSVRAHILDLLEELRESLGLSLVLVSHDIAVVARLCDDVIVMNEGRVVEAGPVGRVFETPAAHYTRKLIDAVPVLA